METELKEEMHVLLEESMNVKMCYENLEAEMARHKDEYQTEMARRKEEYQAKMARHNEEYHAKMARFKAAYKNNLEGCKGNFEAELLRIKVDY